MVYDKIFKYEFLEELRKHALKKDSYSSTTYAVVYNLIHENKIEIKFNTAIMKRRTPSKKPEFSFSKKQKSKDDEEYVYDKNNQTIVNSPRPVRDLTTNYTPEPKPKDSESALYNATSALADRVWKTATGWDMSTRLVLKGGYDPYKKKIKLLVWFYMGIEWEKVVFQKIFNHIFNNILASLLHEGLLIYNAAYNGSALDDYVNAWYKVYFTQTLMDVTNRSTISRFIGNYLGDEWPKYMFNNIEKQLMNGSEPLLKEKLVSDKRSTLIKEAPLIKDYIEGPFKKLLSADLPSRFDIDNETMNEVYAYVKDFTEFVSFMYFNRYDEFSTDDLKRIPQFSLVLKNMKANTWNSKCLGFEVVGDSDNFDNAYNNIYGLKKPYDDKDFFKKNYVFSEMYLPSSIQAKVVYYSVLRNSVDDNSLRLIDYATKGLSIL